MPVSSSAGTVPTFDPPETQTLESGVVIVQLTEQVLVDVLDPRLYDAGPANGETGKAVSVEVDLFPPDYQQTGFDYTQDQTYLQLLNTSSAFVLGRATRAVDGGSETLPFQGFITIDESLVPQNDPAAFPLPAWERVTAGCNLDFTSAATGLQIRVDPSGWFAGIDFATLLPPPAPPDGGVLSCPDTFNFGWLPDSGAALGWCTDSSFNQQLVNGIRAQSGGYQFDLSGGDAS